MNVDQRIEQVISNSTLGPISPLWGVIEVDGDLKCECRGKVRHCTPGKHPRNNLKIKPSTDPGQILAWFTLYPHANYRVEMGFGNLALDLDFRPEQEKNGPEELALWQEENDQVLPATVSTISGKNEFSKHLFFRAPNVDLSKLSSPFKGVDLKKQGYCVTAGSRHISGNYYRFENHPFSQTVEELPEAFIAHLQKKKKAKDPKEQPVFDPSQSVDDYTLPGDLQFNTGRLRPDRTVLYAIHRDSVARSLFSGQRTHTDRSSDDFALCCKLAFYTSHHWDQAIRLFMQSGLFGDKLTTWSGGNYLTNTMKRAFGSTPGNWTDKRNLRPPLPSRKQSEATLAIIDLHQRNPLLTPSQLAKELNLKPEHVRKVLQRLREKERTLA